MRDIPAGFRKAVSAVSAFAASPVNAGPVANAGKETQARSPAARNVKSPLKFMI
jgi:hypothetical protein